MTFTLCLQHVCVVQNKGKLSSDLNSDQIFIHLKSVMKQTFNTGGFFLNLLTS